MWKCGGDVVWASVVVRLFLWNGIELVPSVDACKIWFSQVERSLGQLSLAFAEFWGRMLVYHEHTNVDFSGTCKTVVDHGKLLALHIQLKFVYYCSRQTGFVARIG